MTNLTIDDPVLLAFADEVGAEGPVAVEGARTRWDLGGAADAGTRVLKAPAGIVDYQPEEMTVAVRAGTTVAALHAELANRGQRTGLPDRGGTVGGAVAVGQNDLCVLARGSVGSAVLQIRYVSAEGRVVTGGGPVVKNVSGFNLPKLMVGALGTLGLVAEVVLRTNPIPPASRWLLSGDADPFVAHGSLFRPAAVLTDGAQTWVLLEGHEADVEKQAAALSCGTFAEVDGPPPLHEHRWALPPAAVAALDAETAGRYVAAVGVGTVWAERPQPPREVDPGAAAIAARMKHLFDPAARLNPGRNPGRA